MQEMVMMDDLEITEEWPSKDEEIEYAEYNGVAFTGTAYDKTEYRYSEEKFLNGYAHGRRFTVYTDGQLCNESLMEHGFVITSTSWYKSGAKKSYYRREPKLDQFWSENGILLEEDDGTTYKNYYESGKLKNVLVRKSEKIYYAESGEWAVKLKTEYDYAVTDRKFMTFNEDFISKNYMGLLREYDFYKYFLVWLQEKSDDDRDDIIIDLIKSDVPWHKCDGINLAVRHKIRKAVPYIRLELNNEVTPPDIRGIRGNSNVGYTRTIGESAKIALERI